MSILVHTHPVDVNSTRNVFVSAVRCATSIAEPCPTFGDNLKISAQEQVEYMLAEDVDTQLVTSDAEVKSVLKLGLCQICSSFENTLSSLLETDLESVENKVMHSLADIEWICNVLQKMGLMKEFVFNWIKISSNILLVVEDEKLDSFMWELKTKVIQLTGKVLEAVGYGNVILPSPFRINLLKTWLPYVRKMKPILEAKSVKEADFCYKIDDEVYENMEAAMVQLVLALPSNDQADILAEWMMHTEVKYPDLSEAFEVWCYRTKSAKRRLM